MKFFLVTPLPMIFLYTFEMYNVSSCDCVQSFDADRSVSLDWQQYHWQYQINIQYSVQVHSQIILRNIENENYLVMFILYLVD